MGPLRRGAQPFSRVSGNNGATRSFGLSFFAVYLALEAIFKQTERPTLLRKSFQKNKRNSVGHFVRLDGLVAKLVGKIFDFLCLYPFFSSYSREK